MDVPVWVLEVSVLSVLAVAGYFYRDINKRIEANEAKIEQHRLAMEKKIRAQDDRVIAAIEKLNNVVVPMTHCDHRQEIWELRFNAMLESNNTGHKTLGSMLTGLTETVENLSECVTKLANKKEC